MEVGEEAREVRGTWGSSSRPRIGRGTAGRRASTSSRSFGGTPMVTGDVEVDPADLARKELGRKLGKVKGMVRRLGERPIGRGRGVGGGS